MNPHGRRAAKAQTPPALLLNRQICHLSLTLRGGLCLKQESCYVHKKNNNKKKAAVYRGGTNKAVLGTVRGCARVKLQADRFWQLMFR